MEHKRSASLEKLDSSTQTATLDSEEVEWRCVLTTSGVLSVMTRGMTTAPQLSASNWDLMVDLNTNIY